MTLTALNIHKSYGAREILRGVDIVLSAGQTTCLIGPSGTGKTTLLRILAGLETPDKGDVRYHGRPHIPHPEVGVVFQSLFLWPHMTLAENILLPARKLYSEAEVKPAFDELVADFKMEEFIYNHPNEASLGQRQRVALARAAILKPTFLLLDEITSALDVEHVANILIVLEKLKTRGIGMMIITHLLNFARRAADQVIFMDQGLVVEQGNAATLIQPKSDRLKHFMSLVDLAS